MRVLTVAAEEVDDQDCEKEAQEAKQKERAPDTAGDGGFGEGRNSGSLDSVVLHGLCSLRHSKNSVPGR